MSNAKTDWRDALAALSGLPAGEETTEEKVDEAGASTEAPRKGRRLVVSYERKGRGGKEATIISGFDPDGADDSECSELATTLRRRLGTGGSARGGEILLQGDRRDALRTLLPELGYRSNLK